MEALDLVLLGRAVAAAFLGQDVDDDGAVPFGRVGQGLFHAGDVVAVDGSGVADAEGLEETVGGDHLADGDGQTVDAGVGQTTEAGDAAQEVADPLAGLDVGGVQAEVGQARGELGDGRGVGPAVVVQDDDDAAAGVAQVVEGFVGHAPGEGPVTEDGHHPAVVLAPEVEAGGDAVGVAEGGRGVAVLHPVVVGLGP